MINKASAAICDGNLLILIHKAYFGILLGCKPNHIIDVKLVLRYQNNAPKGKQNLL